MSDAERVTHRPPNGRPEFRRFATALLLALAMAVPGPSAAAPDGRDPGAGAGSEPEIFLSWNAPWGAPGARDAMRTACDDTARVDTLYLSFRCGTARPGITAMEAVLYVQPADGDTLGAFWQFKRGWPNEGNMLIDLDRQSGFPCDTPWPGGGRGRVSYDHRSGRGRLDLSFAFVPTGGSGLDPGATYCVARVMLRHRRASLSGCTQPVCLEFASLRLRPRFGPDWEIRRGVHRFVTWNAPDGQACGAHRRPPLARPWRPPVPVGESPATETVPGHEPYHGWDERQSFQP